MPELLFLFWVVYEHSDIVACCSTRRDYTAWVIECIVWKLRNILSIFYHWTYMQRFGLYVEYYCLPLYKVEHLTLLNAGFVCFMSCENRFCAFRVWWGFRFNSSYCKIKFSEYMLHCIIQKLFVNELLKIINIPHCMVKLCRKLKPPFINQSINQSMRLFKVKNP